MLVDATAWNPSAGEIGDDVAFATKPELARQMIERAVKAEVSFAWVAGDETPPWWREP